MAGDGVVYQIAIVDDEGNVTTVPMIRDELTIGRKEGNVIRLTEWNVSRFHARIVRENGRFYLTDEGSYNGTRLNGRRIRGKMPLSPGDEVGIGDYTLRVEVLERPAVVAEPGEPAKPLQITVVVAGKPNTVYILSDVPHVIGSGDECTIQIGGPGVSPIHARLHLVHGRWVIEDAGTQQGLLIGGQRLRSKVLDPGDVIEIGRVQLYFTAGALKPEEIRARARAVAGVASRLPMAFGIAGALVAVLGAAYLLFAAGDEKEVRSPETVQTLGGIQDSASPPVIGTEHQAGKMVPATASAGALAGEDTGPSAAEVLARARAAAAEATTVDAWNTVLDLLAAKVLSGDAEAAELRAKATRERDARRALDEARQAMVAGDPATASKRLAAIPPDVRCSGEASLMWKEVVAAGKQAARDQRIGDLKAIVEVLREVVAPPLHVARGRDELEALLRRLTVQVSPPAAPPPQAGPPRRHAGGPGVQVRTRPEPEPGGVASAAGPAPAQDPYSKAQQMVLAGDHQGCIDALSRAPQTSRNLELLISCYRRVGRIAEAHDAMFLYVRLYPTARKADEYRGILERAGRLPAGSSPSSD